MSKRLTETRLGAPRKYATDLPVYDSMGQCSAATGIPTQALQLAKKSGCLFVRHGRIHLGEFLRWWWTRDESTEDEAVDWVTRDKRASALTKEVLLQKTRDELIEWVKVSPFINQLVDEFFAEADRLKAEFPANLKGRSEIEIAQECETEITKIKASLHAKMDAWIKQKGQS